MKMIILCFTAFILKLTVLDTGLKSIMITGFIIAFPLVYIYQPAYILKAKNQEIKNLKNKDYLDMNYQGYNIVLKLIDESSETISLITKWRKLYRNNFGSDFDIDENKTKKWIKNEVLLNADKIVFMIYANKQKIGIISTSDFDKQTNSAILDTMMKDPEFELPGLMTTIEKIYLKWMFDELKLSKIRGFLFSDNEKPPMFLGVSVQ